MDNDTTSQQKQAAKRLPFCLQEKSALMKINDADCFEQNCGSALAVYVALTWIASDHQRDNFSASHRHIASRAGVSVPTVKRILPNLNRLGLIKIAPHFIDGIRTRNSYEIIRGKTLAHNEPALVQPQNGRELQIKNFRKNTSKKDDDTRKHETVAAQRLNEKSSSSFLFSSFEEAEKHPLWRIFEAYCESPTLKGFDTWLPKAPKVVRRMRTDELHSLRHNLIEYRKSEALDQRQRDHTKALLLQIKQILKGRGIEYAASL